MVNLKNNPISPIPNNISELYSTLFGMSIDKYKEKLQSLLSSIHID